MDFSKAETYIEGAVLHIDKPLTWTSFDVVNKIRRTLKTELGIKKIKVGHAGTLDPLATGLVIVCTGRATKQINQFQDLDKSYIADIRLGATTPSLDLETEVDKEYPTDHISRAMVDQVLDKFIGPIEQIPPIFSAKSIDGKRAYELARKGQEVKLKKHSVVIHSLNVLEFSPPDLRIQVDCGKGTYIRSLARDIGEDLNSGAHLTGLRRTRIGAFLVEDAMTIEDFLKKLKPL